MRPVSFKGIRPCSKASRANLEERRSALLEQEVPYFHLDARFLNARWSRTVETVSALVAYGVVFDGPQLTPVKRVACFCAVILVARAARAGDELSSGLLRQARGLLKRQLRGRLRGTLAAAEEGLSTASRGASLDGAEAFLAGNN